MCRGAVNGRIRRLPPFDSYCTLLRAEERNLAGVVRILYMNKLTGTYSLPYYQLYFIVETAVLSESQPSNLLCTARARKWHGAIAPGATGAPKA
jgi:hypothetical protein